MAMWDTEHANIGQTRFIPALQSIPNVEVVTVASRDVQKA